MESQEELWVVSCLQHAPLMNLFRIYSELNYKNHSKECFFYDKNNLVNYEK